MKITILPQGTLAIYEQIVNQLKSRRGTAVYPGTGGGFGCQCHYNQKSV